MAFTHTFNFFATRDLDAADKFYGGVLGLALAVDTGTARLYRVTETSLFGVTANPGREPAPGGAILELVCGSADEVHDWHRKITAAGYATDGPVRQGKLGGVTLFFATAPDGYQVEILHFADPKAAGL